MFGNSLARFLLSMTSCLIFFRSALGLSTVTQTGDNWLRPGYHFTRQAFHMNDPNGLMWRRGAGQALQYHMFFQSTDPDQTGPQSQWGHTISADLVRFERLPRTPIRGSSGGGVALPPGFVPPPELAGAKAITINSAPVSPSLTPPTGLHLWYSTDEQLLNWTIYTNASSVQSSNNMTCVICPDLVPDDLLPGYIGDNYVWVETMDRTTTDGSYSHTFYVLAGSTRCTPGHPWCSYQGLGGNSTAQSLLFRSTDLLHWEFVSQFSGQEVVAGKPQQRIDTPDTFALTAKTQAAVPSTWPARDPPASAAGENNGNATQAFIWLSQGGDPPYACHTIWQVGDLDSETNAFVPKLLHPTEAAGPVQGCADLGSMFCQQSLTSVDGHRVSFGWIGLNLGAGAGWDGAQTLPRKITADSYGLVFTPFEALETLHSDFHFLRDAPLVHGSAAGDGTVDLAPLSEWNGRVHMSLDMQLAIPRADVDPETSRPGTNSSNSAVMVTLLGGAVKLRMAYGVPPDQPPPPPPPPCDAIIIHNSSDVNAQNLFSPLHPPSHDVGPEWCRQQCCANEQCTAFVYADPQPGPGGKNGTVFDCWLKTGANPSLKSGEHCIKGGGHCWGGLVKKQPGNSMKGVYNITATPQGKANGQAGRTISFTQEIRPFAASLSQPRCYHRNVPPCTLPGAPVEGYVRLPLMHIFVDGALVEIYFNGEVATIMAEHATTSAVGMEIEGGAVLVTMDAWKMQNSIK